MIKGHALCSTNIHTYIQKSGNTLLEGVCIRLTLLWHMLWIWRYYAWLWQLSLALFVSFAQLWHF